MPKLEKEIMIKELNDQFEKNPYVFFTAIRGLSVGEMGELRQTLETQSPRSLVVKNSLARRVLKDRGFNGESENLLEDQCFLSFTETDPQIISKTLVDFGKDHEALQLRGAIIDGEVVEPNYVKQLAKLPAREVLLGQVVSGINAPVTNFVLTLGSLVRSLVVVLSAVAESKK